MGTVRKVDLNFSAYLPGPSTGQLSQSACPHASTHEMDGGGSVPSRWPGEPLPAPPAPYLLDPRLVSQRDLHAVPGDFPARLANRSTRSVISPGIKLVLLI